MFSMGIGLLCFACIMVEMVLIWVEYCSGYWSFSDFLQKCIVSLHSFAAYHTTTYDEWTEHSTYAFGWGFSARFACIKVEMVFNWVEYRSGSWSYSDFSVSASFHYTLLQYIILPYMMNGLSIEHMLLMKFIWYVLGV